MSYALRTAATPPDKAQALRDQIARHLALLERSSLFHGIEPGDIERMLVCLQARAAHYDRGDFIFRVGDITTCFGFVLSGAVRLQCEDFWDNRNILDSLGPGQSFGEVFACESQLAYDLDVQATEETVILFMDAGRIATMCPTSCIFHATLIGNLLGIVSRRAYQLSRKIEHTSKRTTRAKLLSYLSDQAKITHSQQFDIPFDRQELADYLSVDRSAMSAELSRMKSEGIIDCHKNTFKILKKDCTA